MPEPRARLPVDEPGGDERVCGPGCNLAIDHGELGEKIEWCVVAEHDERACERGRGRVEVGEPRSCRAGDLRRGELPDLLDTRCREGDAFLPERAHELGEQ